jgi:hypothetical protein
MPKLNLIVGIGSVLALVILCWVMSLGRR